MIDSSGKRDFIAGMRAGLPVLFGFIPVGIAYAVLAMQSGFDGVQTILMSVFVFAGASQMMAVGMYAQGAGIIAMIVTTFILNLRHLIMSTCVMNKMKAAPRRMRLFAAFGVTDETFSIYTAVNESKSNVRFFLGVAAVTYFSWVGSSVLGVLANNVLPDIVSKSLGIALYALFIALLTPNVRRSFRLGLLVLGTAAVNLILTKLMPSGWALILSTLLCAGAGVFLTEDEEAQP